jgi:single-strand DNA-binding protein
MNKVTLMGNLTGAPEVKFTPKGTAICQFTIAVTKKWKTEAGEQKESTYFGRCSIFGNRGEAFANYHAKGQRALIEGELKLDEWTDKETGKKRTATQILVNEWYFVNSSKKGSETNQGTQPATNPTQAPKQADLPAPAEDDVPF